MCVSYKSFCISFKEYNSLIPLFIVKINGELKAYSPISKASLCSYPYTYSCGLGYSPWPTADFLLTLVGYEKGMRSGNILWSFMT